MKDIRTLSGKKMFESFKTRQVKYGGYAAFITLAVIAGLLLINLIVGQFSPQADLTGNKFFSLSEQTLQVVDSIDSPVTFYGLWQPGQVEKDVTAVLDLYLARNKNLRLNVVDPDRNPGLVVRFDKDKKGISSGSVIVEGAKGFKVVGPNDMYDLDYSRISRENPYPTRTGIAVERRLTSTLLYVATGTTPAVYELSGHNEMSLAEFAMKDVVERENFTLKQLNLIQSNIPADASALIINAPQSDITPQDAGKILDYLEKGGRLLLLVDYRIRELPVLNEMLASYGLQLDYGLVIEHDLEYIAFNYPNMVAPDPAEHDITAPFADKSASLLVLPDAMGISELPVKRRTVEIKPLLTSSPNSFLRADLDETSPVRIASDQQGPITLAASVMDPSWIQGNEPQARIVVIASASMLALNQQIPWNLDFFMNSLTWLEDRPETLSVRSKSLFILPMRINELQKIIFGGLFVIIIPLALFVCGFIIWLKRRHL
jgi:ABC-type uncharacterized transport system involved in gliding motility auxiliary subunit